MPIDREPKQPISKDYAPPGGVRYRVQDGDTWENIADRFNIKDVWSLIEFNFKTRSPAEVNWYLRRNVGCVQQTSDGKNLVFSTDDVPGYIYTFPDKGRRPAGHGKFVMKEEDSLFTVAYDYGHIWQTIWFDDENVEVRDIRKNPEGVIPGDRINIPNIRPKEVDCSTELRHRFRRLGNRLELCTLTIYTDLKEGEVSGIEDAFTLTGSGGLAGYKATRRAKDDYECGDDGISLIFTGMPLANNYTLTVVLSNGEEVTLFENVPFENLHMQSTYLEPDVKEPR